MLCSHISIIIRDTKPTNNLEYSILKMNSYPAAHINACKKCKEKNEAPCALLAIADYSLLFLCRL